MQALAAGSLRDAVLASAEIIELLVLSEREVLPLVNSTVSMFTDAGQQNAVNSWLLLREFALMERLIPASSK